MRRPRVSARRWPTLTPREREVLAEIAKGKSNAAIAETLVLTKRAVEKHINSIFLKLNLADAEDVSKRVKATLMFLAEPTRSRTAQCRHVRVRQAGLLALDALCARDPDGMAVRVGFADDSFLIRRPPRGCSGGLDEIEVVAAARGMRRARGRD